MGRKEKLAQALELEQKSLPPYNFFGEANDFSSYEDTIKYLRTGEKPVNYEENDLLLSTIEDFDIMCNDYGIE